jgi:hypothetical protein
LDGGPSGDRLAVGRGSPLLTLTSENATRAELPAGLAWHGPPGSKHLSIWNDDDTGPGVDLKGLAGDLRRNLEDV